MQSFRDAQRQYDYQTPDYEDADGYLVCPNCDTEYSLDDHDEGEQCPFCMAEYPDLADSAEKLVFVEIEREYDYDE